MTKTWKNIFGARLISIIKRNNEESLKMKFIGDKTLPMKL